MCSEVRDMFELTLHPLLTKEWAWTMYKGNVKCREKKEEWRGGENEERERGREREGGEQKHENKPQCYSNYSSFGNLQIFFFLWADPAINNKWPCIVCYGVMVLLLQWHFKYHKKRKTYCLKICVWLFFSEAIQFRKHCLFLVV